jgi:putative transcriptional regulator
LDIAMNSIEALLALYAGGLLPEPAMVLVAAHLEINPFNRAFVDGLEELDGNALEAQEPVALGNSDDRLRAVMAAPEPEDAPPAAPQSPCGIFPPTLTRFLGFDADSAPWRPKMPGFHECDLGEIDGCQVDLYRIRPGRAVPEHTHGGSEITLVLDGAFGDARGRFARGDISLADETVDHRPVAETDRPCICMAVMDAPLRLTGSLGRRLADIVGI